MLAHNKSSLYTSNDSTLFWQAQNVIWRNDSGTSLTSKVPLREGSKILRCPKHSLLTTGSLKHHQLAKQLADKGIAPHEKHLHLAAILLLQKSNAQAGWHRYLNQLPDNFMHNPVSYKNSTLAELSCSPALEEILTRRFEYEQEFLKLTQVAAFNSLSIQEYLWARTLSMGSFSSGNELILTPFIGTPSTSFTPNAHWRLNNKSGTLELVLTRDIQAQEKIVPEKQYISNRDSFVNHGIVFNNPALSSVRITLGLKLDDEKLIEKMRLLDMHGSACNVNLGPAHRIGFLTAIRICRICVASSEHVDTIDFWQPMDTKNEIRALTLLERQCQQMLKLYQIDTNVSDDKIYTIYQDFESTAHIHKLLAIESQTLGNYIMFVLAAKRYLRVGLNINMPDFEPTYQHALTQLAH